jgi:peptidylprolyl isomerase domain and WD repeat-containing protein 1
VRIIKFNPVYNLVVSTDQNGVIEVWDPETHELPTDGAGIAFETMSETDYFELVQKKTFALSIEFSHDCQVMAMFCRDRKIRLFSFETGTLMKTYKLETLEQIKSMQELPMLKLEQADFDKRMLVEQEIEKQWDLSNTTADSDSQQNCSYASFMPNLQFDQSDTFLCFGSPIGIKVLNTKTNSLTKLLGKLESNERFLQIALYQGKAIKQTSQMGAASVHSKSSVNEAKLDPTFFCTAHKRSRFYLFTQRKPTELPDHETERLGLVGRDVHNESTSTKQAA